MIIDVRNGDRGSLYDVYGTPILNCITADTRTGVSTIMIDKKRHNVPTDPTDVMTMTYDAPLLWLPEQANE